MTATPTRIDIRPQPGPQTRFLQSSSDITVYGGASGGGKSYGTLLFALRHCVAEPVDGFQAVIFRRTYKRITAAGGLEEESKRLYPLVGGSYNNTDMLWTFNRERCRTTVQFAHLQHDLDREAWKGAQITLLAFDELTEFEESQFFYLQSRNRSTCGVRPQTIATTNPDADSWVKRFLAPWVDEAWPEDDRAASNETRYFLREGNTIRWLPRGEWHEDATSVTFVYAAIYDNRILMERDPNYIKRLRALPLVDRLRLLNGDWTIRPQGGTLFRRDWFKVIEAAPSPDQFSQIVRSWDFAASAEPANNKRMGPDYTATIKMGRLPDGRFVILDAYKFRGTPREVENAVISAALRDGTGVDITFEQEPGASGVAVRDYYVTRLAGYSVKPKLSTGNKIERAKPASSQAEVGNVLIVRGPQTEDFINECEAFPNPRVHDDFVDAFTLNMAHTTVQLTAQDYLRDVQGRLAVKGELPQTRRDKREQTLAAAFSHAA